MRPSVFLKLFVSTLTVPPSDSTCDAISFVARVIEGLDHQTPVNPHMGALGIFDFTLMPDSQEQWDKVKGMYGDKEIEVLMSVTPTVPEGCWLIDRAFGGSSRSEG